MIDRMNAQLFPSLFGTNPAIDYATSGTMQGALVGGLGTGTIPAGVTGSGLFNGGSLLGGFGSFSNVLGVGGAILPGILSGNYGQAAVGGIGAALGTALFPGLGTLLGGAAGRMKAGIIGCRSNIERSVA
jgi:hypothetical protein